MEAVDANYVDDGTLREQDGVPLPVFLADKDRAQLTGRGQPFFSGREREVNAFRSMANALLLGRSGNATVVVEGPPRAGKSALMAQFQEEMRTLPPTGSGAGRWLPVTLDGALAMSPQAIMSVVDGAIAKRLAHDDLMDARDGDEEAPPPSTVLELADLRGRHWSGWQIVLPIDEAHRHGVSVEAAAGFLRKAKHNGLLETDGEGRCSMPVPSFANHLLGEAARCANGPAT